MEAFLDVQDLTKTFPAGGKAVCTAVDRVSFRLREGEALGLVGESGCGKSTLAKLLTRLIEPTAGTIRLEEQDITKARGKALRGVYRQMQMVFQSPVGSFDPRKTIGSGIGESLANHGLSRAERGRRVAELLEQCGLPAEFAGRYPHEISGGECQRAAIARALAIQPKLLRDLRQRHGLSLLFICHNLALVQSLCDEVLVMHSGEIVERGSVEQVIRAPQAPYTRQLIEAAL